MKISKPPSDWIVVRSPEVACKCNSRTFSNETGCARTAVEFVHHNLARAHISELEFAANTNALDRGVEDFHGAAERSDRHLAPVGL
mgnify:CR=1 FL=1